MTKYLDSFTSKIYDSFHCTKGPITWASELSRLSKLTRFAELTRFLYVLSIILTFRLHAKRVVPPCRDRGCSLPSQLA
jgi:hypothetical protein